jgi:excisionase family DNA binding protein
MTITEAAQFLGVSASTLRNWDRARELKPAGNPMNRYRFYQKTDLEKLLRDLSQCPSTKGRTR